MASEITIISNSILSDTADAIREKTGETGKIKAKNMPSEIRKIQVGTGSNNYEELINKPSIELVELIGNKTFEDLGLEECSNEDILAMFQ